MQELRKTLPLELWRVVLSNLHIEDLCRCCQVSKSWQELVQSLDTTRWKDLYLFQNAWQHPNWPNRLKENPISWQEAYKQRFLDARKWLKLGSETKCSISLLRLMKKPQQQRLDVGYGQPFSKLRDALNASSAFDTICIHSEIRDDPIPLIIKHPIEIIGRSREGKVKINTIEIQCSTTRICNVILRSNIHRQPNPLSTVLKVSNGCLCLENCMVENGHVQVMSPGSIYVSYCMFKNASIQIRTSNVCKITNCDFQTGDHSAILIEGTQSLSKQKYVGVHISDWMSRYKCANVKELYSHEIRKNTRHIATVHDEGTIDSYLLVKNLKNRVSLSDKNNDAEIPAEMSQPLSQRTQFTLGTIPYGMLQNSTGCIIRDCKFHSRRGALMIRRQGSAWLESNEISNVVYGVRCVGSSKVVAIGNMMQNCTTSGLFFRDRSTGLVAGNVILRNGEAGIDIRSASDPYVIHNQILHGRRSGIVVLDGGRGTLMDNDIYDNKEAGVYILYRGNPVVRCNRIWAGQAAGIAVTEDGYGQISYNDICGMEWGGIDIRNGGHPVILNNTIHKGHGDGVVIGKNGCGLIFENVIKDNTGCGVWVLTTSRPVIFGNEITGCGDHGVAFVSTADHLRENQRLSAQFLQQEQDQDVVAPLHVYEDEPSSASYFDENDTASIEFLSPHLEKNTAIVDNNTISHNKGHGVFYAGTEGVIIRGNILTANHGNGIVIEKPGDVFIHSNSIHDNTNTGIHLAVGTVTCLRDNSLCGNHGNGIVAYGRGRIKDNDIVGNLGCGVELLGPGDPFISKNRIFSGKASAIVVQENARGYVNDNDIYSDSGQYIFQHEQSLTTVENNTIMTTSFFGKTSDKKANEPVNLSDMSCLMSPRPYQTGNGIPRSDISHIVGILTMNQTTKNTGRQRTMSRFCVLL